MRAFHESDRYDYPLTRDSLVVDGGAFHGNFAREILGKYHCRIICFEPIPEYCKMVRRLFGRDPQVSVHQVGLGRENATKKFFIRNDSSGEFLGSDHPVEVDILGVPGFLILIDGDDVDLLKLNIEGGEFDFLEGLLDVDAVRKFKNIQVQWHPVVPHPAARRDAIIARLQATHECSLDDGWTWQNWVRK